MGLHKGWRIYLDRGAWVGAAWDATAVPKPRYKRKRHETEGQAKAWAKGQHLAYEFKSDSLSKLTTKTLATDYIAWLTAVKKRSPSHLRNVKRALDSLQLVLADITDTRARAITEQWLAELQISARTKQQYLVTAKSMCRWAVLRDILPKNPLAIAETEEPDDFLKPLFSMEELRTIARAVDDPYHRRASLMCYAGLRSDEAAHIRGDDINMASRVLTVSLAAGGRVKRRKERLVTIQQELAHIIWPPMHCPHGRVAYIRETNDRRAFAKFLARIGIPHNDRSPHSLRHSYAVLMTATGIPSLTLQGLMGHANTSTTSHYTHQATAYLNDVKTWQRGEFQLLQGWSSHWPRSEVN